MHVGFVRDVDELLRESETDRDDRESCNREPLTALSGRGTRRDGELLRLIERHSTAQRAKAEQSKIVNC